MNLLNHQHLTALMATARGISGGELKMSQLYKSKKTIGYIDTPNS